MMIFKKIFFLAAILFCVSNATFATSCNIQNISTYKIHSQHDINCVWQMYHRTHDIAYPIALLKFINKNPAMLSMVYEYENRLMLTQMMGNAAKKLPYYMTAQGMGAAVKKSCPRFNNSARGIQTQIETIYAAAQSITKEGMQHPKLKRAIISLMKQNPMKYNFAHKIYCSGVAANEGEHSPKVQNAFCQTFFKESDAISKAMCGSHHRARTHEPIKTIRIPVSSGATKTIQNAIKTHQLEKVN